MAQSPSSSPRLPSPPPMAEDQIGPTSPGVHGFEDLDKLGQSSSIDNGASRRIRPGTKSEDMHEGPPLVELQEIDSAFQLSEHLKSLFSSLTYSSGLTVPITRTTALQLSTPPPGVDRGIWLYELCRLLVTRANTIITSLFADAPPCSAGTCPEMRASEWQYLCAAHDPPKSCCAIDYCCHTLDWSATQLTSSKLFPSRLALGTENVTSNQQLRKMTEIFRRVYRIFAHAWFQHREVFWRVEGRTGLYLFFKTVCDEFRLIPEDSYTVPPEAEGGEEEVEREREERPRDGLEEEMQGGEKGTQKRSNRMGMPERQNSVSTVIHEEVEEEYDEEEGEEEPQRGTIEVLGTPEEEVDARLGDSTATVKAEDDAPAALDGAITEETEISVEKTEPEAEEQTPVEPKTETTISAPAAEEEPQKTDVKEVSEDKSADSKEVEAAEEKTATDVMDIEAAPAGEADEADKTVAD
ncbi:Mob1/phocein-like protein 1 [Elsinoe fawcettii]|nr:Mob1/phocein-like protein 1 [Elsinoe fawcettii]